MALVFAIPFATGAIQKAPHDKTLANSMLSVLLCFYFVKKHWKIPNAREY